MLLMIVGFAGAQKVSEAEVKEEEEKVRKRIEIFLH